MVGSQILTDPDIVNRIELHPFIGREPQLAYIDLPGCNSR